MTNKRTFTFKVRLQETRGQETLLVDFTKRLFVIRCSRKGPVKSLTRDYNINDEF